MPFVLNKLYKHINCRDIVIKPTEIIKTIWGYEMQVDFYNVHYHELDKSKIMYVNSQEIYITNECASRWREYIE